jgi:hypothetical protein
MPMPTIRRSSFPAPAQDNNPHVNGLGQRRHTVVDGSFGRRVMRRDTVEETNGCRRHMMVLRGSRNVKAAST